ncbi:COG4315 family predicted lipoprotein [Kibdelosporangium aridum]|uniref:hypothetical protein n=1 Tax=Kibdelosporangium aridum TaxID=2030 RepID=UPI001F1E2E6C|nr:hypothetical protein [Kibdelosporangium aridum]
MAAGDGRARHQGLHRQDQKQDVGTVRRDDGSLQLTVGGWPVYRFNKDKKPGDTFGQGVGGKCAGMLDLAPGASSPSDQQSCQDGMPGTRVTRHGNAVARAWSRTAVRSSVWNPGDVHVCRGAAFAGPDAAKPTRRPCIRISGRSGEPRPGRGRRSGVAPEARTCPFCLTSTASVP